MKRKEIDHQAVLRQELATIEETAAVCRVTPRSVWGWLRSGKLTRVRLASHTTRIRVSELKDLMGGVA